MAFITKSRVPGPAAWQTPDKHVCNKWMNEARGKPQNSDVLFERKDEKDAMFRKVMRNEVEGSHIMREVFIGLQT